MSAECNDNAYQVIVLVDVSSWFKKAKTAIVEGLHTVFSKFYEMHPHSHFLLTTFSDYPLPPYGCAERGDHCFKKQSEWTGPNSLKKQLQGIHFTWGIDETESVDTAINHIAHSTNLFSSEDVISGKTVDRIVIVVTDEGYHLGMLSFHVTRL